MLATLTDDGAVQLWDTADLRKPRGISKLPVITTGLVSSIAFSPDGTLATGGDDGTIRLWDLADLARPQPIGQPLDDGSTQITSIIYSPDDTLAAGNGAGILLWNLNVGNAIQRICTTTNGSLTAQQWHQYIPQLPYQPPCTTKQITA